MGGLGTVSLLCTSMARSGIRCMLANCRVRHIDVVALAPHARRCRQPLASHRLWLLYAPWNLLLDDLRRATPSRPRLVLVRCANVVLRHSVVHFQRRDNLVPRVRQSRFLDHICLAITTAWQAYDSQSHRFMAL